MAAWGSAARAGVRATLAGSVPAGVSGKLASRTPQNGSVAAVPVVPPDAGTGGGGAVAGCGAAAAAGPVTVLGPQPGTTPPPQPVRRPGPPRASPPQAAPGRPR